MRQNFGWFLIVILAVGGGWLLLLSPAPPVQAGLTLAQPLAQLAAGEQHTCAITSSGVKCWGDNYYGQLGDGGANERVAAPVAVGGLESGVTALTAGDYHTCALRSAGEVKCWGYNSFGQLGDNTTESKATPLTPGNLSSGVTAVAAGRNHTCAITSNGGVQCWGLNNGGQLGDGTLDERLTPVAVVGLSSGVSALAAGNMHTCALLSSGGVTCWGRNAYGQLGDGTTKEKLTPVDVVGLESNVTALTAGYDHTCAVLNTGSVQCWGRNDQGQLGNSTINASATPVNVKNLSVGVRVIAAAAMHTCVITNANDVKCWGDNATGQLGDGTTADRNSPTTVAGLTNAGNALATGVWHTCVAINDGSVSCWGWNGAGQLGEGAFPTRLSPVDVVGLSNVSTVTAGGAHTCALLTSGGAKCWGKNFYGQLGDNTGDGRMTPVDVSGLSSGVGQLAAGAMHSCALTTTGAVKCWGRNAEGQLGNNDTVSSQTPVDVVGLSSGVTALTAGDYHTCVVIGGGVRCWGQNDYGQVGDGTTTNRSTSVEVISPGSGVSALAGGLWHTCAVIDGGGVQCWGKNDNGQLGDGTTTNHPTPVTVSGLSGVTAIAAGSWHTCAVTSVGEVKCWGRHPSGQALTIPTDVVGVSEVRALGAGKYHTCALTNNGAVKCWGGNIYGQLGNGTMTDSSSVVEVAGLSSGITALAGGELHNCAVAGSGGMKCWGSNHEGQLGDGTTWRTTPVTVVGLGLAEPTATLTPAPTGSATATLTPTATATLTATVTPPPADANYEPNDSCAQARPIPADGSSQEHTFQQPADVDWIQFPVVVGVRYLVQVEVPSTSPADVVVEIYDQCGAVAGSYPDGNFAPGVHIEFTAARSGVLFVKSTNLAAAAGGATLRYTFAVRALDTPVGALILVAGSIGANDPVLTNIYHVTDAVRQLFRRHGYEDDRIRYLAADPNHPHVNAAATVANLQAAITTWAVDKVGPDRALTLYLMDHGDQGRFYLDKSQNQAVTAAQLDDWLSQLEASQPGLKVNVIIEACYAGSFISQAETISQDGRVIITSTSDQDLAWASPLGALFSDYLIASLDRKASLASSFQQASSATARFHRSQVAWLDADGNGRHNEAADYTIAAQRGFGIVGTFPPPLVWPPHIDQVAAPTSIAQGRGVLRAQVRDDGSIKHVWAVIYPPDYRPPNASAALVRDEDNASITTIRLSNAEGAGWYSGPYAGFDQPGAYRAVIYAEDDQGATAQPAVLEVQNGSQLFLPLVVGR